MDSRENRPNPFDPATRAYADAWLQIRAKPLAFILIWVTLALLPQLLLGLLLQDSMVEAMDVMLGLIAEGGDYTMIGEDDGAVIVKGFRAMTVLAVLLAFFAIYLGSVVSGMVDRFRNRRLPEFLPAFSEGAQRFPAFFMAVLAAALRILVLLVPGYIVAVLLGLSLGDPIFVPISVAGFVFIAAFLRYGLGPYIHLALGIRGRDAVVVSRAYFRSHRPAILGLFMIAVLFPLILLSLMGNFFVRPGVVGTIAAIALSLLQSIALFTANVVYVNFAMNNFHTQDWGIGESTSGATPEVLNPPHQAGPSEGDSPESDDESGE